MSVPKDEQETTINFGRGETHATIWTCDRTVMTRLDRLVEKYPTMYECIDVGTSASDKDVISKAYRFNKRLLSFRTRLTTRTISDEQRNALKERMMMLRDKAE